MDKFFKVEDINQYEDEIENIVSSLWFNLGDYQKYMQPSFVSFLQTNLLRPIYIYYFSMKELIKQYDEIIIKDSTTLLDIVANHFMIDLPSNRKNHDLKFGFERLYYFNKKSEGFIKRSLRKIYCYINISKGINVLYLNAGKLDRDFNKIDNSMSATFISQKNIEVNSDVEKIEKQSILNIKELDTIMPKNIILDLLHCRVYCHLENFLSQIKVYFNFIKLHNVNLIIISAATHEDNQTLLAAANIAGIKTLSIGHGYTTIRNNFLNGYLDFQGTINNFEYQYSKAKQMRLKMSWFDEKNNL
jgi:hypothetical protein